MVQHIEIDPASLGTQALFNVMTGSIVPRPIGWVSTVDRQGARNLAPYSMFTAVCAKPPTVV
ncbi:MAG: flavin reductase family protein, partial [Chloroflexi bacterium]|nr:flavin reductase family protein [Chloroflexota bacterium]